MWLVIGLTMILLFNLFNKPQGISSSLTYSEFISSVTNKTITRVVINGDVISGTTQDQTGLCTGASSGFRRVQ
jgi:cell division protease FtsH